MLSVMAAGVIAPTEAQTTKVLFIGNSYVGVNDLPNTFRELALSLGDTVEVASSTPGGYTFSDHIIYAPTLAAIGAQPWDYVVLQEQSQLPSFPIEQVETECFPFAAQLVDSILANDSCSQAVFYMTWSRQNGDADNCASWPPVCTYDGMQALLRERYLQMAFDNEAFAAPAGAAWKHVRDTHPLINLYNPDQSHPSVEGTYLVASVFYSTIFRESSAAATFVSTLDPDTAAILRGIASSTVLDSLGTWNIGVHDPDAGFTMENIDNCHWSLHPVTEGQNFWDFGDGDTSSEAEPVHFFHTDNFFTSVISHTVTDGCGRISTLDSLFLVCIESVPENSLVDRVSTVQRDGSLLVQGLRSSDHVDLLNSLGQICSASSGTSGAIIVPLKTGVSILRVTDGAGTRLSRKYISP